MSKTDMRKPIKTYPCKSSSQNQLLFLTQHGELRREDLCLDYNKHRENVYPYKCNGKKGTQVSLKLYILI
jgi:Ricin-type beta-trefoil lectin domain